jgi:putative Mg2+ transporter-C (MgtC) family protein
MELFEHAGLQMQALVTTAYAMLLGGAIGFERELKNRPAGFRTHMLVAGAAAMLVGLVDLISVRFADEAYRELVRLDPIRLIEAAVAAVGFLGAGTIFRSGREGLVSGITTAASLLMVSVIGIAAGVHAHLLAVGATLLTLSVLLTLGWIERHSKRRSPDP